MYLAIDEGTTNLKVAIFNEEFKERQVFKSKIATFYPQEGWVEQDMAGVWAELKNILKKANENVEAIGITNQRETTVIWDKNGMPVHNAIVWQCRRTANMMKDLAKEWGDEIRRRTGLEMDAYFSASKIKWLLDNVSGLREKAEKGEVMFGTVDSYLLWNLTGGKVHLTDHTNASRTMLYNIHRGDWDDELLDIFHIPDAILPEIVDSAEVVGYTKLNGKEVPISGMIGDQQAALLAHSATNRGDTKATYGTGTFLLANTGSELVYEKGLISTVAWSWNKERTFAIEGSILSSGTMVEWLKSMGLWSDEIGDETSLYIVPAFSGLGSPYWDPKARGAILGITPYTEKKHITRAALEAVAYMVRDTVELIKKRVEIQNLRVDGGMSKNQFLMQFQADILNAPVKVSTVSEMTARGAALAAAVGMGELKIGEVNAPNYDEYFPKKSEKWRDKRYRRWKEAVRRSMGWAR